MRPWPILLLLTGCNATLPPVPKEVLVPVPVPCIEKMPDAPIFLSDFDLAKLDDWNFVLELRRDQLELRGHVGVLNAVLQACLKK
jgi:hypothetical protein